MNLKKTIIIKRSKLEQPFTRGIEMMMEEDGGRIMFLPDDCTVEYVGEDSKVSFEQRWVPTVETMPPMNQEVLIQYKYREDKTEPGNMYFGIAQRCIDRNFGFEKWSTYTEYQGHYEVVAWMPLPKPYEGRDEDDNGKGHD